MPKKAFQVQLSIAESAVAGTCHAWQCHGAFAYPCPDLVQSRRRPRWASVNRCDDQRNTGCRYVDGRMCASDRSQDGLDAALQRKVPARVPAHA